MKRAMNKAACALVAAVALATAGCGDQASVPPSASDLPAPAPAQASPSSQPATAAVPSTGAEASGGGPVAPSEPASVSEDDADAATNSNSVEDVNAAVDQLLGDHVAYQDTFARLQHSVGSGDKDGAAALVNYPIEVSVDGKNRKIKNAAEFVDLWDKIITPEINKVIVAQRYQDLFVNSEGIMFGSGEVWISEVCLNTACSKSTMGITKIQSRPK